jgi:hypothetical protein
VKTRIVYALEGRRIHFYNRELAEREQECEFQITGKRREIIAVEVEDIRDRPAFHDRWNEDGTHEGWYGYADGRRC